MPDKKENQRKQNGSQRPMRKRGGPRRPPANVEMERRVLISCIMDERQAAFVTEFMEPKDFFQRGHGKIFEAVGRCIEKGTRPEIEFVEQEMAHAGEGGWRDDLWQLSGESPFAGEGNLKRACLMLKEQTTARGLVEISQRIGQEAYDSDALELQQEMERAILANAPAGTGRSLRRLGNDFDKVLDFLDKAEQSEGMVGLPTGYARLDEMTNGFQEQDFIICGADTGVGKTSWALGWAELQAFDHGNNVAVFSSEMDGKQLLRRLLAHRGNYERGRMNSGQLTQRERREIEAMRQECEDAGLFVDDARGLTIEEVIMKARRFFRFSDGEAIVIDYLQNFSTEAGLTGEPRVSYISRELKNLARAENKVVLATSQVQVPQQGDRRPGLRDLRGSRMLGNDADVALLLYRAEHYGIQHCEHTELDAEGLAEGIVGKLREGKPTKTDGSQQNWLMHFQGEYGAFRDGPPASAPF